MKKAVENSVENSLGMAKALGLAIRLYRGVKRKNQAELAKDIGGVTQAYISKIEAGKTGANNQLVTKIVRALGITHQELWNTAEQIDAKYSDTSDATDYLACLTETGVPAHEVQGLVAEVDLQTVKRIERLSTRVSSGEFKKEELRYFVSLIDGSTVDKGPLVRILGELSKEIAQQLSSKNQTGNEEELAR